MLPQGGHSIKEVPRNSCDDHLNREEVASIPDLLVRAKARRIAKEAPIADAGLLIERPKPHG
jgi:hypothetical protein